MKIEIKRFKDLSTIELYQLLQLRSEVFVVEQNCIYQDIDGKDDIAWHLLGKKEDRLVAYLRIFERGDYFKNVSIGRVVVAENARKRGYAKKIMEAAMGHIFEDLSEKKITLSAQTYLIPFYQELGFESVGEGYLEDGIPHIKMEYG